MRQFARLGALLMCIAVLLAVSFSGLVKAQGFEPNDIIDDAVFNNSSSMSASQIDSWLNSNFGSASCISTDHGFTAPVPTGYNPTSGFLFGSNVSAGQVISTAAQVYGINPQVLLATIQKEQGIVSGTGPYGCTANAYAATAGYGCPDSGSAYNYTGVDLGSINGDEMSSVNNTCVDTSLKAGFSQQVIRAAWLLKFGEERSEGNINWAVMSGNWNNSDDPQSCYGGPMTQGTYQICPGGAATFYDGYTTIDGQSIHMDTGSTATLFYYTPHLSGNENFWTIFNTWFGPTTSDSYVNTLNFIRLNYYTGNVQLVGYTSIGSYSYTNRNTTVPYPDSTSVIPLFRPNGDLSFVSLDDPSGKVKVTTFSAASNFQQLSSVIYVPYPAVPDDGSVIPLFRPNGDISFVRLNYYTGKSQIVTYSYGTYFQQLSSNIVTSYPAVPTNGSVVPLFQPDGDLSFVNLAYYTGYSQVVTYSFSSYFQQPSSNYVTAYPAVPTNGSVVPLIQPNGDLSFVNLGYYNGSTQIVTYSAPSGYGIIDGEVSTGYPNISDFSNVKTLLSTAF